MNELSPSLTLIFVQLLGFGKNVYLVAEKGSLVCFLNPQAIKTISRKKTGFKDELSNQPCNVRMQNPHHIRWYTKKYLAPQSYPKSIRAKNVKLKIFTRAWLSRRKKKSRQKEDVNCDFEGCKYFLSSTDTRCGGSCENNTSPPREFQTLRN